jgi:short-subunit dehydrogenase
VISAAPVGYPNVTASSPVGAVLPNIADVTGISASARGFGAGQVLIDRGNEEGAHMRHALFVAALAAVAAIGLQAQDGPYHFSKEISIGGEGGWDYLSVDPAAHRLYVSHATHIAVIDTQAGKVVGDIPDTPGVHGFAIAADLGRADIGELVATVTDDIEVGLFIYNAAFAPQGLFVNVPLDDLVTNIAVNVTTPTILSHMLGKKMVERGRGGVVLVSSGAAHGGMKIFTTYAAAKAYELILGEGLWDEFRDHGVDALGYVVGATATPTFVASSEEDAVKATNARTPEQVAAQLFEVLGTGPRGYSHPGDEERAMASAGRPRAEVVAATGEMISSVWG